MGERLDEQAARTPATRDRYVDFLRAFSIIAVVFGHWFSRINYWEDGVIGTTMFVRVAPTGWILTWLLQVMPLFFFVGGFSNLVTYRSFERQGRSTGQFLRTRLARLLGPTIIFLLVWAVGQGFLNTTGTGARTWWLLRGVKPPGATLPFGPLWFVAGYAFLIVVSPVMIALHRRFGAAVPVTLVSAVVVADWLGFVGGVPEARWTNVVFVLLLPHQLGFFYADGRLARMSKRAVAMVATGALAALILLTNPWIFGDAGQRWFPGVGHYPRSLVGTDALPISNANPPTVVLVAMAFWWIGLAMLLREPISRWLKRRRPWRAVVATNSVIMTLFLWHMTAYLLAMLALWPLGFGQTDPSSARWWIERPLWIVVPGVILLGLVQLFGRFERRPSGSPEPILAQRSV